MRRGDEAIVLLTLVVLWPSLLLAQKPPSLEEQLRAQYDPATILTIQKQGVFAVASTSGKLCAVRYQDGKLNPAESSCLATLNSATRTLTVGEKINPSNIDVDLAKEKISFRIIECDSCNKGVQSASFKSQIDFQFAKGYLERADVPQVVDAISEVLAFPDIAVEPPPKTTDLPDQAGGQPDGALTNSDVMRMSKVKLPDGIIISKIKSSQCNFDMTVDGMVQLKTAGVSDAVIQAMQDAQQATTAATDEPGSSPGSAGVWLGFANETASQDREAELHQNCRADFRRVYVPRDAGNKFTDLCSQEGKTCERVCDWEGHSFPCTAISRGGRRDGTRIALCRSAAGDYVNAQNTATGPAAGSAPVPGQASFSVRHRHSNAAGLFVQGTQTVYYCSGTLSVSGDGTVAYDCSQTDDPSGRCEHVSFAPGSLKQAKVGVGGNLHLASKAQGNYDFYGDDVRQAQAVIAPLVQTTPK
jgi:hypothetical protein